MSRAKLHRPARLPSPPQLRESAAVIQAKPARHESHRHHAPRRARGPATVDRERPVAGAGRVLIRVRAAGINRPDVLQRKGVYPPPPGASDSRSWRWRARSSMAMPAALSAAGFKLGDAVCALVAGGGYAELCVAGLGAMPAGAGRMVDVPEAASLPETFFTVWRMSLNGHACNPVRRCWCMVVQRHRRHGHPARQGPWRERAGDGGSDVKAPPAASWARPCINHREQDFVGRNQGCHTYDGRGVT